MELEERLVAEMRRGSRLLLSAPTGSGKSTQVPQILLRNGFLDQGQLIVLQPRRLAARLLAKRVAQEMKSPLGGVVGYQIRLDDVSSRDTRIKFVTEGILMRMLLRNPRLSGVSAIVFDEFHERHLSSDLALAVALRLQKAHRPDLKLIVMSATLETERLLQYLHPCPWLESQGRVHPVTTEYLERRIDFTKTPVWAAAADAVAESIRKGMPGHALVFMPGAYEIQRTLQELQGRGLSRDWLIAGLHGEMPAEQQDVALSDGDRPRIIVATNVAETSITIDGIRLVVDSGLAKIARFDPHRGINTLLTEKISQASAEQRKGRAGRTAPGHCVRLWTDLEHRDRRGQELPEIKRVDLSEAILHLKEMGEADLAEFPWLEAPESISLNRALALLHDLGALEKGGETISETGRRMLAFPLHPRYARMLIAAEKLGCVRSVAWIVALTQERNLLLSNVDKRTEESRERLWGREEDSDLFVMMQAWIYAEQHQFNPDECRRMGIHGQTARQVGLAARQFLNLAERQGMPVEDKAEDGAAIARCVLAGFSDQLARRLDGGTLRCDLVHGRRGVLARESVVRKAELLVANEIREAQTREGLQVLLTLATRVEEEWLLEMFAEDFSEERETVFDSSIRKVVTRWQKKFRDLTLAEKTDENKVDRDAAARLLTEEVLRGNCTIKAWDDEVEQFIIRLNCLAQWWPDLELPSISGEDRKTLIEQICYGSTSYKEVKDKAVWPVLKGWLSASQSGLLDRYAPVRYALPGGKQIKLQYAAGEKPVLAARIQDLYGVEKGLSLADGRVDISLHVLAPNFRPVQITSHLGEFWKETYPKLKPELQRRYPKHQWR